MSRDSGQPLFTQDLATRLSQVLICEKAMPASTPPLAVDFLSSLQMTEDPKGYAVTKVWEDELHWSIGYPLALCLMLLSAALPLLYFRRRGCL